MSPLDKHERIALALRRWILDGTYRPGERLPTVRELTRLFRSSSATMQRAITQLREEGFLGTAGRRGTFVADQLPHHVQVAVVMPHDDGHPRNHFCELLRQTIELWRDDGRHLLVFETDGRGAAGDGRGTGLDHYTAAQRLAGVIRVDGGEHPVPEFPPLAVEVPRPGAVLASCIECDHRQALTTAIDHLVGEGRGCPAFLVPPYLADDLAAVARQAMGRHGIPWRPTRWQMPPTENPPAVNHLTRLLLDGSGRGCPDALVLMSGAYAEPVAAALDVHDASADRLLVMSLSCFPSRGPAPLPAVRFGFDVQHALAAALECLDQLLKGEACAERLLLRPTVRVPKAGA